MKFQLETKQILIKVKLRSFKKNSTFTPKLKRNEIKTIFYRCRFGCGICIM